MRAEIWLLEDFPGGLSTEALADRLSISRRTALRDLETLRSSGYPLSWVSGLWQFVEGQPLPTALAADNAELRPERDRVLVIDRAIRRRRPIAASYFSAFPGISQPVELAPLVLRYLDGSLFLVARDHPNGPLRVFALERLSMLKLLKGSSKKRAREGLEQFLEDSFSTKATAELIRVAVRFEKETAWRVTERIWHPSQRLTVNGDKSVTATFRVPGFSWIRAWVLSFGSDALVTEPIELVRSVSAELDQSRERYRGLEVELAQLDLFPSGK